MRSPTAGDLVVPSRRRKHRRDPVVHAQFLEDFEMLGLRGRRVHDTRYTFISLTLADGADRDKLAWVTHGPKGDIVSLYTTLHWKVSLHGGGEAEGGVLASVDAADRRRASLGRGPVATGSGRPGKLPSPAPHRSGRAEFPHPALRRKGFATWRRWSARCERAAADGAEAAG